MFGPLAITVAIALLSSLHLSIFIIPVLCSLFLKPQEEKESRIMVWAKSQYLPLLEGKDRCRSAVRTGCAGSGSR